MNKQKTILLFAGFLCLLLLICVLLFPKNSKLTPDTTETPAGTAQDATDVHTTAAATNDTDVHTTAGATDATDVHTTTAATDATDVHTTTAATDATDAHTTTAATDATDVHTTTAATDATDVHTTTAATDATDANTTDTSPSTETTAVTVPTDFESSDTQETTPPPTDLPPAVVIPGQDEETGLSFPCHVPGYDLVIQKLAPYTGLFVEDGTNTQKTDVAMLLIHNEGSQPLEYAQIALKFGTETLEFHLSALPEGESAVVQEHSGKTIPADMPLEASVLAVLQAEMSLAPEISVTDNGDNSLTIENLTDEEIPAARIFYKYYMEEEALYVGGIAFTVRISHLPAMGKLVIRPSHYISKTGRVVMTRIYDTNE